MQKTISTIILHYNNNKVLEQSLKNLKSLDFSQLQNLGTVVLFCGYPGASKQEAIEICQKFGATLTEIKNLGQTQNIKNSVPLAIKADFILGWEPDSKIENKNYLNIAVEAISETGCDFVVPKHQEWVYERQGKENKFGRVITFAGGWPSLLYTYEAWLDLLYLVPSCKGPYGGTEMDIYRALLPRQGIMLRDVVDETDQSLFDQSYQAWKHQTIGKDDQTFYEQSSHFNKG